MKNTGETTEAAAEITVENSQGKGRLGLTGSQVKWIALVIMTIDHIGAYAYTVPVVWDNMILMRTIGRIAAPLFLFMMTESARYTRSRKALILRLYGGGLFTGLFVTVTNNFLYDVTGIRNAQSNIMYTFFFTVLFIQLLETAGDAARGKNFLKAAEMILILLASVMVPVALVNALEPRIYQMNYQAMTLLADLLEATVPTVSNAEYGFVFILLGTVMYFAGKGHRYGGCAVFFLFWLLCLAVDGGWIPLWALYDYTGLQLGMIMALPFMLLYNGERGRRGSRNFFYIYYPVHRYVISLAASLLA